VPGRVVIYRDPQEGRVERLPDPDAEMLTYLQRRVAELESRLASVEASISVGAGPAAETRLAAAMPLGAAEEGRR
jgi:hypothetical protein